MTQKNVGKKMERKGKSLQSYTLYDNCDICPLWVYIDIVCENKLESIIIEGNPSVEKLENTKSKLLFDFNNLLIEFDRNQELFSYQSIYNLRSQINELILLHKLILYGEYNYCKPFLRTHGIYKKDIESSIKSIESKIKALNLHLEKNLSEYRKKSEKTDKKITRRDYDDQLAAISKHMGFRIDKNVRLSEYASYVRDYNYYVESIKISKHAKQ